MQKLFSFLISMLLFINCSTAKAKTGSELTAGKLQPYALQIATLNQGPLSAVNFSHLRLSYAQSTFFADQGKTEALLDKMAYFWQKKNYKEVLNLCQENKNSYAAEIDFHYYARSAYEALSFNTEASWHSVVLLRLLNSILISGSGKSKKDPILVISPREEAAILNYFGLKLKEKKRTHKGKIIFDSLHVEKSQAYPCEYIYFKVYNFEK